MLSNVCIMWLNARLGGNPVCIQDTSSVIAQLCESNGTHSDGESSNRAATCNPNSCAPPYFEYIPDSDCFCVAPFEVVFKSVFSFSFCSSHRGSFSD